LLRKAGSLLSSRTRCGVAVQVLQEAEHSAEDEGAALFLGRAYVAWAHRRRSGSPLGDRAARKGKRSKGLSAIHRELSRIRLAEGS